MSYILYINITMSLIFISMNHPLSMGLILLIQTTSVSLISGMLSHNYWYSYILFLIMVGGMLILFMYMTSIASNEKFKIDLKIIASIPISFTILMFSNINLTQMLIINEETSKFSVNSLMQLSMSKFINYPLNIILVFMMIYLLMTLIATVKISSLKSGPLRQMF